MSRVSPALARDLAFEAELGRVLRALSESGVEVILLKGAAYRGREYARGERRAQDSDLLVRPRQFRKAQGILRTLGYAVKVRGEARAVLPPFELDLHEALYGEGDAALWSRAEKIRVAGASVWVLSAPDAFAYALWHGAVRHAQVTERLLEDLSRIAERGGTGFWTEAAGEIRARGLGPAASVVLPRLRMRGVGVPASLLKRGPGTWVLRWALKRGPKGGTGHLLMALSSKDRWRAAGRLARTAGRFFSPGN